MIDEMHSFNTTITLFISSCVLSIKWVTDECQKKPNESEGDKQKEKGVRKDEDGWYLLLPNKIKLKFSSVYDLVVAW